MEQASIQYVLACLPARLIAPVPAGPPETGGTAAPDDSTLVDEVRGPVFEERGTDDDWTPPEWA